MRTDIDRWVNGRTERYLVVPNSQQLNCEQRFSGSQLRVSRSILEMKQVMSHAEDLQPVQGPQMFLEMLQHMPPTCLHSELLQVVGEDQRIL